MNKHTPGPWRVEEGTTLIWGECNPDDLTTYGMGYPIAECRLTPAASWAKGPRKYEEAEANARLIAAAPDMLKALRVIAATLPHMGGSERSTHSLLAQATDAIAKATSPTLPVGGSDE